VTGAATSLVLRRASEVQHRPGRGVVLVAVAVVCQRHGEMGDAPPDGVSAAGFPTHSSLRGFPMPAGTPNPAHDPARVDADLPDAGPPHADAPVVGGGLLDAIEYRFRLAHLGPAPLSVDGRQIGHGLPRRRIPLPELSAILMHPSCDFAARDTVWRLLVTKARTGDEKWVVGAVGVAIPGLRNAAARLARTVSGDVQAALVTEFVAALATVELDEPRVVSRLLDAATSVARAALRAAEPATSGEAHFAPASTLPPPPYGHPDLVLAHAVKLGVVSAEEADLIGTVYLEDVPVAEYADAAGVSRWTVYKRLTAAKDRLVQALACGELSDPDVDTIAEATLTTAPPPPPRRRP
jgi:predicted DNA-binding protein (UPF0251 family)